MTGEWRLAFEQDSSLATVSGSAAAVAGAVAAHPVAVAGAGGIGEEDDFFGDCFGAGAGGVAGVGGGAGVGGVAGVGALALRRR